MALKTLVRTGWMLAWAMLLSLSVSATSSAQGTILSTGGPVHRGMGGASTAAPIDAIGALYWNPATISGLEYSELEVGVDLLYSEHSLTSTIGGITGTTDSENGAFPIPNIGWVYHTKDPALTIGLGVNAVAGFKTNVPSDPTNPLLAPAPGGIGRVSSEASFLNLTPTVSLALSDRLSIGGGPVIGLGQINAEPFVFDSPNGNGAFSPGQASRYHWGGGVQVGAYYIHDCAWRFGASIKSPMWFERFRFFGETETGAPRVLHADFDLPMIISMGTSYTGIEDWLFAVDLRYFDYEHSEGFGDAARFNNTSFALEGLGWDSVFALAIGAQRKIGEKLYGRVGYTFNENPISDSAAMLNVATPLVYEHMLSCGASYQVNETMAINLAYSHMFENDATGPVVLPGVGVVGNSSLVNELSAHFLSFGIVMRN